MSCLTESPSSILGI